MNLGNLCYNGKWWKGEGHILYKNVSRIGSGENVGKISARLELPSHSIMCSDNDQIRADIMLANWVRNSGKPNVYGLKIQLSSGWNFDLLNSLTRSTSDREVMMFLKYGWLLNRELNVPLMCTFRNHLGVDQHQQAMDTYLQTEIQLGGLIGPLPFVPWQERVAISPMMTRPKKKSSKIRIITDLSYPLGASVNDGIPKDEYMGMYCKVQYPTVDQLCKRAVHLSKGQPRGQVQGFKVDLNRAFRQIPLCPRDWSLMGTTWKGQFYFDKVTVMGSRTGPMACQRVTNMIRHIHAEMGYDVRNFVDDFMGIKLLNKVWDSYWALKRLLRDLGASEATDKAVAPTYLVEFLGILFDLLEMTMEIPGDKVQDLLDELQYWLCKGLMTRKQLESLLGKLQFASICIRPGRVFVSRVIGDLRQMGHEPVLWPITTEMKRDLRWWCRALQDRNAVCMMWLEDQNMEQEALYSDACLKGGHKFWEDHR